MDNVAIGGWYGPYQPLVLLKPLDMLGYTDTLLVPVPKHEHCNGT